MTSPTLPPGPRGVPVFGHAIGLSRGALPYLRACATTYGDLVPLRFFGKRVLLVNHPDYIGQVLAMNHRKVVKSVARRADYALIGDGISLGEGDVWRRDRRIIQPAFHHERLAAYSEIMVAFARGAIDRWREGETRDIAREMSELTIGIVVRTLFGADVRAEAASLPAALAIALSCRDARVKSLQLLLPDRLPTPIDLKMRRARRQIDRVVYRLIDERRRDGGNRDDLLSMLLSSRQDDGTTLSDRRVRDEIMAVVVAGHETVANLLTWAWYLLATHPTARAALDVEIDTVLGDRWPTVADLPRLPLCDRMVSETLRLYPPAPALLREAIDDVEIGDYRVAKGTDILVSQWVMHRDSRYFSDPSAFEPDRWSADLASRLPRFAYFPFGGGPRVCIGRSFATMEAILVLATIVQRFRLEVVPGHPIVAEELPTLRPKFGLPMIVRPRRPGGALP